MFFLAIVVIGVSFVTVAKMAVAGSVEVTSEAIEPVFRSTEKIIAVVMRMTAFRGRDVQFAAFGLVIENRGVIAAVKVGVCFDIKMPGKKPAAITQSYCKYVG